MKVVNLKALRALPLAELRPNDSFTDFTLIAGDSKFKVHKCILCCRSHVLKERILASANVKIKMKGHTPDVVDAFTAHLYGQKMDIYSVDKHDLWKIAKEFEIPDLQVLCEMYFVAVVTIENCLPLLKMAVDNQYWVAQNVLFNFIKTNKREVFDEHRGDVFEMLGSENAFDLLDL